MLNRNSILTLAATSQTAIKFCIVSCLVLSLVSLLGFISPFIDIFSHFRWQYAILLFISAVYALMMRMKVIAGMSIAGTLINAALVGYLWLPPDQAATSSDQAKASSISAAADGDASTQESGSLSILNMNLYYHNYDYAAMAAEIQKVNAEVVTLEELTPEGLSHLKEALASYPYQCTVTETNPFGIGIFSKREFVHSEKNPCNLPGSLIMQADVNVGKKLVSILAIHNFAPISARAMNVDNEVTEGLKRFVADRKNGSIIVIGDINSSPWSNIFSRLFHAGDFVDSERGFGLQASWPTTDPLLMVPIDHCFFTRDWRCTKRQLGDSIGSDHYPLLVELTGKN